MPNTAPMPFAPIDPKSGDAVDELLASTANLTERPFEDDDDWREVTRPYDLKGFEPRPIGTTDRRSTVQMLKDGKVGLDLFLNETSVALIVGHADLTDFQRAHIAKILTFVEALSARLDQVMAKK